MALQRNPNDPYAQDPTANDDRRSPRLDQEVQSDPAMLDSRVSGGRIAAAAVAIVVLIGALYYGMNMSSSPTSTATQDTPAQTNAQSSNPAAPPAVRDVTPNRDPGTTTGAAPALPQTPASPPSSSGTNPSR